MADAPVSPYARARSAGEVAANVADIRARIDAAATRAGRDPAEVRLLPVSKTVDDDRLAWVHATGIRLLGENKAQEARRKAPLFDALDGMRWAMIGHLQTNKVRDVAGSAAEFHALDSLRVAEALDRRLQALGRSLDVFVQVNSSGETSKYGLDPADLSSFLGALAPYASLRVRGLMTLALHTSDPVAVQRCFALLRTLRDRAREVASDPLWCSELSMGMSGDFELAIEEGATTVRVGQAIFGSRATRDEDYWPA